MLLTGRKLGFGLCDSHQKQGVVESESVCAPSELAAKSAST